MSGAGNLTQTRSPRSSNFLVGLGISISVVYSALMTALLHVRVLLRVSVAVSLVDRVVRRRRTRTRPSGTGVLTASQRWRSCTLRTTENSGATGQPSPTPRSTTALLRFSDTEIETEKNTKFLFETETETWQIRDDHFCWICGCFESSETGPKFTDDRKTILRQFSHLRQF